MAGLGFHLTPFNLEAAYAFLQTTPPFNRWKLPSPDEVEFVVNASRTEFGACVKYKRLKEWSIEVSSYMVSLPHTLLEVMAHEMIHLYQGVRGVGSRNTKSQHDAEFHRFAKRVCAYHGFDPKRF